MPARGWRGRARSAAGAVVAAALLAALAAPAQVWGWGHQAHDVICRLAWQEASVEGRGFVTRLLGLDSAAGFAAACSWADSVRRKPGYAWTEPHHYVNVPRGRQLDVERDCPDEGCVLRAIGQQGRIAADQRTAAVRRAEALKLLAHLVGDLHQPLHVSHGDDAGGNQIRVRFCPHRCWKSYDNLHRVWDRGLLAAATPLSAEDLTETLRAAITAALRRSWREGDVIAWAEESFRLAIGGAYRPVKAGKISSGYIGDLRPPVLLDAAYVRAMRPVVLEQLQKAGVRLARVLDALAKGSAPAWLTAVRPRAVEASGRVARYTRIHAEAKPSSPPIGRLHRGEQLELLGREGRWYRVRLADGREGYVRAASARVRRAGPRAGGVAPPGFSSRA